MAHHIGTDNARAGHDLADAALRYADLLGQAALPSAPCQAPPFGLCRPLRLGRAFTIQHRHLRRSIAGAGNVGGRHCLFNAG